MSRTHTEKKFYSKVILFGEYSMIQHSMGLVIPYTLFDGKLTFRRDNSAIIDPELKAFSLYLKQLIESNQLNIQFDVTSFEFDISQGLYFDSTIPQGYGVGSSGALVAAVFDRYEQESHSNLDISKLKRIFAQMESHFHGASSGMDPLISYLNSPILIKNKNDLGPVTLPKFPKGKGGLFLLNTKRSRKTEPLVNLFLEKTTNARFNDICETQLKPITNNCIENFLAADMETLTENFKKLSEFQFEHLSPMIPKLYRDVWVEGIKGGDFALKLCGAGGGGFLMGITRDFQKAKQVLSAHEIRLLLSF
ncbi:mevalonate kinase [Bacteriovorax stolpii]|uniref:Mevalonate kinase n=1 Tax=Bacteriovorax stolpii TaxID=960 RepID=A0A2K9NRK6_BACTC|nr:mevalonate kinase [Bacteriovorax stolpii]AUN98160.1 mevalonate kinase [Bacteriovorax stolpii]QDK41860.1 mevalonate kinase [Bacteriovorax stolpii]TDP52076.1 mevalonate kinase [Bacteriovorax stolpii]BDT28259.1 mevalonate kinase [Bacteriovorax sp. HI3]